MVGAEPKVLEALMAAPLSRDLRERIVRSVAARSSARQAAARFAGQPVDGDQIDAAAAPDRKCRSGQVRRLPAADPGSPRSRVAADDMPQARHHLGRNPSGTGALGVSASLSTIHLTLWRLGLRHKKRA